MPLHVCIDRSLTLRITATSFGQPKKRQPHHQTHQSVLRKNQFIVPASNTAGAQHELLELGPPKETRDQILGSLKGGSSIVVPSMDTSPIGRSLSMRRHLRQQVAGLNGKPFTEAFYAAATGQDTEQVGSQLRGVQSCIAYYGAQGGPGEQLATSLFPDMQPVPCAQHEDVFVALTGFAADKALVPIENSLGGSIHAVLDLFLRYNVTIEREASFTTRLCLLGPPGTQQVDVQRVVSDTSSLLECDQYLKGMPRVTREAVTSTSHGAEAVIADEARQTAAVALEATAHLYGLEILDRNIQDNKSGNVTRYVILSRDPVSMQAQGEEGKSKISVVFAFPEKPGELFNCLSAFALRDVYLTKIESRPFRDNPTTLDPNIGQKFQFYFYVDFNGSLAETKVQNAIVHLKEIAPFVRILGCYPIDTTDAPSPAVETLAAEEVREQIEAGNYASQQGDMLPATSLAVDSDSLLISAAANIRPIQQARQEVGMSAAYQGNPGAYSESAVLAAFPDGHPVPCAQFEDAFQALSQYLVDRAVLPIENSLGGSIHAVYDLLVQYKLYIVGEVTVPVNHCLLALPGVKKSELKRVISHYQALAQVDGYTRGMPGVVREAVDDTAGAAQMVAQNGWRDTAAVASARAGQLYGLDSLDTNIQDNKMNFTRFLVLSRDPRVQAPSQKLLCKTSVVFSLKEGPGELFKACSVFALRGLDMTKIESRPLRLNSVNGSQREQFRYLFYVDFIASLANSQGQNALRHLSELATFIRVLGCYPKDLGQ